MYVLPFKLQIACQSCFLVQNDTPLKTFKYLKMQKIQNLFGFLVMFNNFFYLCNKYETKVIKKEMK